MNIIKPATNSRTGILKGVSTLDVKNMRMVLLFLVIIALGGNIYAGHSILDRVDPVFNPEIEAHLYGIKVVNQLQTLPDGKILAYGLFNSYNRIPTGNFVRLNADGSLDTTFNNQLITSQNNCGGLGSRILRQPNGKILVACSDMVVNGQAPRGMLRLNADGTLDTSFNFTQGNGVARLILDSLGRILLSGSFQTPQGTRKIVRLNDDGSFDSSFNYTTNCCSTDLSMAPQGNRLIVGGGDARIFRLNENGSEDTSFTPLLTTGNSLNGLAVTPDNKILYLIDRVRQLNENGGIDNSFQSLNSGEFRVAADGKITLRSGGATFNRFLPSGAPDPSFTQYSHPAFASFVVQPDGGVIIGDVYVQTNTQGINNFIRLSPGGVPDPAFNPGGVAFQTMLPGNIRTIEPLPNGKIFLGGQFDEINTIPRPKIARLNADSSVDPSFQINTGGTGNYFSQITDVYHIHALADGKVVVSGWFDYVQNGVTRKNLVRLNSDGSIDTTFNLTETINDWSVIVGAGRNPLITFSDGKVMIGISRLNNFGPVGPLKFNQDGSRDTSFTSMLNPSSPEMYIDDLALQPDGKILVSGTNYPNAGGPPFSFVARLNTNGSLDPAFPYTQEAGRLRPTLALLPNGKILVGKSAFGSSPGTVKRLNSDGSTDTSFNSLSIPGANINALLALPNGKIFVGGKFTVTVNGQPGKNLLQLREDGSFESTTYNLNEEVLCLAVDGEGRVLVGGTFTVIGANGGGESRSYVARLTDSTPFDFDGDGKSDLGVFRGSNGTWYLQRSSAGELIQNFGINGDKIAAADYDGDGKTDLAIYRNGDWWYLNSSNGTVGLKNWGTAGDIPLPSDFDADGKADFIYYRPSTGEWFRSGSSEATSTVKFGIAGDMPLVADMDGDGRTEPTIFRPSSGTWWYRSSVTGIDTAIQWGENGDVPVPGDFDADGKTDTAVFRPSNGVWYILNSTGTYTATGWGLAGDKPVAADYDGDGKADIAIWRPSTGVWYILQSTAGFTGMQYGLSTDKAVENAFLP